jgi:uncharacterized protein (DUF1684 family)
MIAMRWIVGLSVAAAAVACTSGPPPPADARPYDDEIRTWRNDKDAMFRTDRESPLLPPDRATFTGLPYYGIDPAYRVPALLTREETAKPVIIQLQTSDGDFDSMQRVGSLGFTLNGTAFKLTAFAKVGESVDRLFVPFGDQTNGSETYKGGRYLDLSRTPTGLYDLDFNRAYHPFCVFNINFVCPVPPPENRLDVAIRAGERLPPPRTLPE